ncbi:MAG: MFS transporter, partial [Bacteroides sp.]
MKTIQTGKGTIPLMTLIAIWSISLVVNLPGLAISPMLGELHNIFPSASELEVQLLTILPNLLIIPFVLISG